MRKNLTWVLPLLTLGLTVNFFGCSSSNDPFYMTPTTPTPTVTSTSPTPTPGCASFTDTFASAASLSNYVYYDGAWIPSSAAALGWSVTGGEFQHNPGIIYSYELVANAQFNQSLGDYTVEGDFLYSTTSGVFGLVYRATQGQPHAYILQWNGINGRWEIEKQTGVGAYYYPGTNGSSAYTVGTWVHLKVTVAGALMNAWITPQGGSPTQIFTNVTDPATTTPYASGAAGIRSYNIASGNPLHVKNFTVYNCAIATPTPSAPSPTPTCTGTTYSDPYASNTAANYAYYDGAWSPTTDSALHWTVTGGEFQMSPSGGSLTYSYVIASNSVFSQSLGDYRVEGDFNFGTTGGVFGVVCRATAASYHALIFQWNGINNRWEIEKQIGVGTYYYPGTNTGSPYSPGTWVHLKLVAGPGNLFNAWITPSGGSPQQIFANVTDPGTTTPYTSGGAGIRSYNITTGNTLQVDNFIATTCP